MCPAATVEDARAIRGKMNPVEKAAYGALRSNVARPGQRAYGVLPSDNMQKLPWLQQSLFPALDQATGEG